MVVFEGLDLGGKDFSSETESNSKKSPKSSIDLNITFNVQV